MRILQVNKFYPPVIGGIEQNVELLAHGLALRGVQVSVLVCNTRMRRETARKENLHIIRVESPGKLFSMPVGPTTPYWMSQLPADIMHIHMPYPMAVVSALLTNPDCHHVVTWHSDIIRQRLLLKAFRPFLDRYLQRVDRIVATSPKLVPSSPFLQSYQDKVEVIPLGIDLKKFELTEEIEQKASEFRERFGERIVLFVGRLVGYKGLEYLLEAAAGIEGKLVIVGEGILAGRLTRRAIQDGLGDKVHFTGFVSDEDLAALYHACDVFVLPSISNNEAMGIVQLEAMACRKPVVSTNLPTGVPFVNVDQETGFVVPPCDAQALADAINRLLAEKSLREEMGEQGKQRVKENFTSERMLDRMEALYEAVLGQSSGNSCLNPETHG